MLISLETMNHFCNVTKIARHLHEEATPIGSFDELKSYEVSISNIKDLGDALQLLGEQILMEEKR